MDYLWTILFLLWYELLSLPLRWVMVGWSAPADVRRIISRLAGPPLLALPIWLAAHFGPHFLDQPAGLAWIVLAAVVALLLALRQTRSAARLMAYEHGATGGWPRQVALDVLMTTLVLGFVAFRRWVPEMTTYQLDTSAAEKFVNAMIFWSSWHARHLPPEDYWLAGTTLNYYYWGHFQWAWVARVGSFPVALALNLAFAMAVTMVWAGAYLLGRAARLPLAWAAGAGLCVAWAGNPAAVAALKALWPGWQAQGSFPWGAYNYWGPSRAIPNVVDEFPAFSAILGDFHSHHLALPWLTGWMALGVAGRRWRGARVGMNTVVWGLTWVVLGTAAVLSNLWNLPLLGLGGAILLAASLRRGRQGFLTQFLLTLAITVVVVVGMRLLRGDAPLPLPESQAPTLWARLLRYKLDPALRSPLANLFGLWGFPMVLITAGAFIKCGFQGKKGSESECEGETGRGRLRSWWNSAFSISHLLVLLGVVLILPHFTPFGPKIPLGVGWVWAGVCLWIAALMCGRRPWLSRPAGILLILACAILGGLEVAYLPDRFVGELARYNSYFKFSYPAWPILWVGAWVIGWRLWRVRFPWPIRWALRPSLAALVLLSAVYTVCAVPARIMMARYNDTSARRPSLNAFDFLDNRPLSAPEAPLLEWIRRNVPPGERIAEGSVLPSNEAMAYDYQGRIASLTGHPIPIGWVHHEQQWRGPSSYNQLDERVGAVNGLYKALTPQELERRATILGVRWIVYGVHEAAQYGPAPLALFKTSLPLATAFPEVNPTVYLFKISPNKIKTY